MSDYEKIIYWSEADNCYLVEVPDLPGCMADGVTEQDASRNADVIIQEWIETARMVGRSVPTPRSVATSCAVPAGTRSVD